MNSIQYNLPKEIENNQLQITMVYKNCICGFDEACLPGSFQL